MNAGKTAKNRIAPFRFGDERDARRAQVGQKGIEVGHPEIQYDGPVGGKVITVRLEGSQCYRGRLRLPDLFIGLRLRIDDAATVDIAVHAISGAQDIGIACAVKQAAHPSTGMISIPLLAF